MPAAAAKRAADPLGFCVDPSSQMPWYLFITGAVAKIAVALLVFGPEATVRKDEPRWKAAAKAGFQWFLLALFLSGLASDLVKLYEIRAPTAWDWYACAATVWGGSSNVGTGAAMNGLGMMYQYAYAWPHVHEKRTKFEWPETCRDSDQAILQTKGPAALCIRRLGMCLYFIPCLFGLIPFTVPALVLYLPVVPVLGWLLNSLGNRLAYAAVHMKRVGLGLVEAASSGQVEEREHLITPVDSPDEIRELYVNMVVGAQNEHTRVLHRSMSDAKARAKYELDQEAYKYLGTTRFGLENFFCWPLWFPVVCGLSTLLMGRLWPALVDRSTWEGGVHWAELWEAWKRALLLTFGERHWYTYVDHAQSKVLRTSEAVNFFLM